MHQYTASRTSPLPRVSPCEVCTVVALGALWRQRRPKRGFSKSPREASRRQQERGALKWSRPHPGRPSGGLRGAGGRGAPRGFFAIPRGFDQNEGASQSVPWRPQNPSGEPSRQTLLRTQNPREPLKPTRSLEMLRGHRGEGMVTLVVPYPLAWSCAPPASEKVQGSYRRLSSPQHHGLSCSLWSPWIIHYCSEGRDIR